MCFIRYNDYTYDVNKQGQQDHQHYYYYYYYYY